ncbi:hypothetical protein AB4072_12590 [Microvirga sp. 2MCAF38]|uniref:hypothetical protein n=1 Tax=Microvirga sp. 2MCAF38 TaxID=3232989 RepID=UPI003F9E28E2
MRTTILTTLVAATIGAASLLAGAALPAQAQTARHRYYAPANPYAPAPAWQGLSRPVPYPYYPYEVGVTGALGPGPDLWPACYAGPPTCTAAGYPNLHYYREIYGGR